MKYFLSRTTISAFVITTILGLSPMNRVNAQENSSDMLHNESKEKK